MLDDECMMMKSCVALFFLHDSYSQRIEKTEKTGILYKNLFFYIKNVQCLVRELLKIKYFCHRYYFYSFNAHSATRLKGNSTQLFMGARNLQETTNFSFFRCVFNDTLNYSENALPRFNVIF